MTAQLGGNKTQVIVAAVELCLQVHLMTLDTKAECQRIDAFELWYWRRLLRGPWSARRSHQSILKEINPEDSLELMPKLKLQYFGYLMQRADSLSKILMLEMFER